ncbi:ATP-dependent nuclease [Methylocucumis oryzae]|uniref:ATP-dependent nuclease n=1 Tax=Methylocucumis oryzae TaxID=1632867 RepID=UPI000698EC73|nr:AAA family ATPase [Methylocucumis oryzae]
MLDFVYGFIVFQTTQTFANKYSKGNFMHLNRYCLRNFRRLEDVTINLEETETIFVGANNAGKTSATAAFRLFVSRDRGFKIHDFSSPLIAEIDKFGQTEINPDEEELSEKLPSIQLDLWFTVSPSINYGLVAHLLPTLQENYSEVGIRICFSVDDPVELHNAYLAIYPKSGNQKPLSHFLSQSNNLTKYFSLKYFVLERFSDTEAPRATLMDKQINGPKSLSMLLRVDYVDAQRNIDDKDSAQSNRLSSVFTAFYTHNLNQRNHNVNSAQAIDKNNEELTQHYETEFKPLIKIIAGLGFPGLNDRGLKVISNLSPEKALSGNTAIAYLDNETNHELPEAYNGLGFKNLIYLAIQIAHFQIQWVNTETNRPWCQLIFVEEPEAHLHAQVQQTFIRKIREVMKNQLADTDLKDHLAQLVITTHSSHIVAEADFQYIRYFRRSPSKYDTNSVKPKAIASEIFNIANFQNEAVPENITFLKKYLKLTHCDLFFADAAILVEGTVERLLMPTMIKKVTPELQSAYLTILELGGAYAHRFAELLDFIKLPTLVITDLDSVDPNNNHSACRANEDNAVTSNASIKSLLLGIKEKSTKEEKKISSLIKLTSKDKICSDTCNRYVTFQQEIPVPDYGSDAKMIPRTF